MSADPVGVLVADLLQQRRQRADRVQALAREIRGLPVAPEPPDVPIVMEMAPSAPEADPVAPYREALLAMRAERDLLQKRNLELADELGRLKAELEEVRTAGRTPSPVRPDLDASLREIGRILASRGGKVT